MKPKYLEIKCYFTLRLSEALDYYIILILISSVLNFIFNCSIKLTDENTSFKNYILI